MPRSVRVCICSFELFLSCLSGLACGEPEPAIGAGPGSTGSSTGPDAPTTTHDTPTTASDDPTTTDAAGATTTTGGGGGTDTSSWETTTGSPWCGNGVVEAGEACDESAMGNSDNGFCKENCTLNVCGDGALFVGWELCDEGGANSDQYGSLCGTQCEPGARCGDHKVQPEYETCDLGLDNGGPNGDEQGIRCDPSCRAQRLRGFVTEAAFDGALGGLFGADLKCRAAATAAKLAEPERFHAFLSTGDVDAKDRFEKVTSWPYVLVTGKKFADSFAALIEAGPLGEGIAVTEHGNTIYEKYVATNTMPGGIRYSPDQHCQDWTSAEPAYVGRAGFEAVPADSPDAAMWEAEQWWTGFVSRPCNKVLFHLYCLEI